MLIHTNLRPLVFVNKIYHPNVDETSGFVCLDVINQTWSPMFDLANVFEVFLPQPLLYSNPSDPLNGEAATFMIRGRNSYEQKAKRVYAGVAPPEEKSSDEELTEDEYASSDEEVAGKADPETENHFRPSLCMYMLCCPVIIISRVLSTSVCLRGYLTKLI